MICSTILSTSFFNDSCLLVFMISRSFISLVKSSLSFSLDSTFNDNFSIDCCFAFSVSSSCLISSLSVLIRNCSFSEISSLACFLICSICNSKSAERLLILAISSFCFEISSLYFKLFSSCSCNSYIFLPSVFSCTSKLLDDRSLNCDNCLDSIPTSLFSS